MIAMTSSALRLFVDARAACDDGMCQSARRDGSRAVEDIAIKRRIECFVIRVDEVDEVDDDEEDRLGCFGRGLSVAEQWQV